MAETQTELHTVLDAPPDEVWQAITDQDSLGDWLGADVDLSVEVGSAGRVIDEDGTVREVLVTEVDAGRSVGWHWWDDRGDLSSVRITIEPTGPGTLVRVVEIPVGVPTSGAGWSASASVPVSAAVPVSDPVWGRDRLLRLQGVVARGAVAAR